MLDAVGDVSLVDDVAGMFLRGDKKESKGFRGMLVVFLESKFSRIKYKCASFMV
ncbi:MULTISPECIES: hypothetical protein [unclassified Polaribacter]|uniref:hypothetical protein n=1 Tax=unclassified Polaribacter TaxID=196858 RepID=UPI00293920C7|nr:MULTISPECIES: hypothetical protein [unclassified Polaribacter]